jgi:hypothetical protein
MSIYSAGSASKSFATAILPLGELQSDSASLSPSRLRILPAI